VRDETEDVAAQGDSSESPPLPGGVGLSRLQVYDWPGAESSDGICGGTPHVHLACSEAYAVVGGSGAVQTLTAEGFASTRLAEGDLLWFTPGTVHRLVNGGDLRIVVLMQNAGLPEAGDAVLTFPSQIVCDPDAYRSAAAVDPEDPARSARARRDLAVTGFVELRRRVEAGDRAAMAEFHEAALRLVAPELPVWRERVESGPGRELARTRAYLDALAAGDASHLSSATVRRGEQRPAWGMCGRLLTFPDSEAVRSDRP